MMSEEIGNEEQKPKNEESFAELLEQSMSTSDRLKPGQKVKATVIGISGDRVYIALGGKSEGAIALDEFRDENGTISVKPGDEVEAAFVSVRDGVRELTTKIRGIPLAKMQAVREAFHNSLAVVGEVKRVVKGGFEVSIDGVRAFCPASQIDLQKGKDGSTYVGQTMEFSILECSEDGRNIILSRRVLLDEERKAKQAALKASLEVGKDVTGKIRSIQKFGAFLDLGGIDGLIPASELSWNRGVKPEEVLTVGQEVTAKIISIDWDKNRVSLSLKALQPDPWTVVAEKYRVGSRVEGTVVRLTDFGAFVSLEPGLDGLIHISNFGTGRRIHHPKEVVTVGQSVEVFVLGIDPAERRISLSLQPQVKREETALPSVGEIFDGTVESVMPYGVFVKLENGVTGLIPNAELGTPFGTDHSHMFPVGTTMRVEVIDVDSQQRRVRLSRKAVFERAEREELRKYQNAAKSDDSAEMSTLGALLKAKMQEKGIQL
jgi:small subunit ribosomal protein S1